MPINAVANTTHLECESIQCKAQTALVAMNGQFGNSSELYWPSA